MATLENQERQKRHSRDLRIEARLALTKAEAAQALGVSVDYLDDHIWGELKLVRRGRRTLVSVKELQAWLDRSATRTLEPKEAA